MNSKSRSFAYWQARFSPLPVDFTLQDLLGRAFDNTKARDRRWPPIDNSGETESYQFIGQKFTLRRYFCANFLDYADNTSWPVIRDSFDQDNIEPVEGAISPAADGTIQLGLVGKLYFVCHRDDLILSQERTLKANHLETFLNIMLPRLLNTLPPGIAIRLSPFPKRPPSARPENIKRAVFASLRENATADSIAMSDDNTDGILQSALSGFRGEVIGLVRNLLRRRNTRLQGLGLLTEYNPDVSVVFQWPTGTQPPLYLDEIQDMFRHVDEESDVLVKLESRNGDFDSQTKRIRRRKPKNVKHNGIIPDMSDISDKMIEWHRWLIDEGKLEV